MELRSAGKRLNSYRNIKTEISNLDEETSRLNTEMEEIGYRVHRKKHTMSMQISGLKIESTDQHNELTTLTTANESAQTEISLLEQKLRQLTENNARLDTDMSFTQLTLEENDDTIC